MFAIAWVLQSVFGTLIPGNSAHVARMMSYVYADKDYYSKEIACFSYDEHHELRLDDSSIRYYYPPTLGADLSKGFDTFQKLDDTADEHLDSLLKTIVDHEKQNGTPIEADVITWRGMMTKVDIVRFEHNSAAHLISR